MRTLLAMPISAVAAAVLIGLVSPTGAAVADPVSSCSPSRGVLVVVDFVAFGGALSRGCDATITTGLDALHDAGFATEGTRRDGPGFVCRIAGKPSAGQEPCIVTPPASRYWSYWHANAGDTRWTYSQQGASSYRPRPGSIDAWVYGATDLQGSSGGPDFTPAQIRGPAPRPVASTSPARPPRPATQTHSTAAPARTAHPAGSTSRTPAAPPRRERTPASTPASRASGPQPPTGSRTVIHTPPSTGPSTVATHSPSVEQTVVDVTPSASGAKPDSSSVLPVVLGLGLVVVLGAGAGVVAVRRRRGIE